MNTTEKRITSKIIRELSLFFMFHGLQDFTITTRIKEDLTELITRTPRLNDEAITKIKSRIDQERKLEIETYGWELVGDFDSESELEIVGHLIDDFTIVQNDDSTTITFFRRNQYRKKR